MKLLRWLHERYAEEKELPDEDERRVCEAIRVVIDAGWVMTGNDLSEILRLVSVKEERIDPEHPAAMSKMIVFQEELRSLFTCWFCHNPPLAEVLNPGVYLDGPCHC